MVHAKMIGIVMGVCAVWTIAPQAFSAELAPSPLLAIDRNRATVVDGVVAQWGTAIASAGITAEQLRELLLAMRSDQLLAASLAGSLDGLRNVVSASLLPETDVKPTLIHAKALGDATQDVVYVPVTPCRLVETRGVFPAVYQVGGPFAPNEVRTYTLQGGNGVCLTQLPASVSPSAVQMQVYGIPTTTGSGDIEVLPQGSAFGSSASLVYLGTSAFTSSAVTSPANVANKQISVQVRGGGAHVAIDIVGYFRPPAGGYVSSVTAGTGLTGGTITGSGTIAADTTYLQRRVSGTCAAGSSIRTINADGTVVCEADDAGTGTVTSVATGAGLTGGPVTSAGTINLAATQLLPTVACANGQVPGWNGASWTCTTPSIVAANVNLQDSASSTVGNLTKPGGVFMHNFGINGTFAGVNAGNFSMTGSNNSAFGYGALAVNASGLHNTALGTQALAANTSGSANTAAGLFALGNTTSGGGNTAVGWTALSGNVAGSNNTVVGSGASILSSGSGNTAVGRGALNNNTSGSSNIAIGDSAGTSLSTGNFNIVIGNAGVNGEAQTIRIGTNGDQTRAFIAGVRGVTTGIGNGIAVLIDSNGQLGTVSSSRDAKDDIADMQDASAGLMRLRPVVFHYRDDHTPAGPRLQYGLIAEEVEGVYPGLVAQDSKGKTETVMYQYLGPMLLNEYQKQQRTIEALVREIAELRRAVGVLMAPTAQ